MSIKAQATEAQHQEALFRFLHTIVEREPRVAWAFHAPNGALRNKVTAARLKAQGVKPGVPDLLLPVATKQFHGLAVELKRHDGRLSPSQETWLDFLETQGWCCVVAWSWEQAAHEILLYLGHDPANYGV